MGYRSDVGLVFYTTAEEELPFGNIKLWFDENFPKKEAVDEWGANITYGTDYVYVKYDDVKWYESYEHPQEVQRAIVAFTEAFAGDEDNPVHKYANYDYVRIGEEDNDVDVDYSDYSDYRLRCMRALSLD